MNSNTPNIFYRMLGSHATPIMQKQQTPKSQLKTLQHMTQPRIQLMHMMCQLGPPPPHAMPNESSQAACCMYVADNAIQAQGCRWHIRLKARIHLPYKRIKCTSLHMHHVVVADLGRRPACTPQHNTQKATAKGATGCGQLGLNMWM